MNLFQVQDQRPVNLDNVSTVFVADDKVIFHFTNARTLKSGVNVPDYLYWNINSNEQQTYEALISNALRKSTLVKPIMKEHRHINMDNVSSIGYDDNKQKIIFNFNFSISHPHYKESLIAAYEFWEFGNNTEMYEIAKEAINTKAKGE